LHPTQIDEPSRLGFAGEVHVDAADGSKGMSLLSVNIFLRGLNDIGVDGYVPAKIPRRRFCELFELDDRDLQSFETADY